MVEASHVTAARGALGERPGGWTWSWTRRDTVMTARCRLSSASGCGRQTTSARRPRPRPSSSCTGVETRATLSQAFSTATYPTRTTAGLTMLSTTRHARTNVLYIDYTPHNDDDDDDDDDDNNNNKLTSIQISSVPCPRDG